MKISKMLSVPR